MKKCSFTLMEVLLAMAIIGIIAGTVANQIKGVSADKVKLSFRNNYIHMSNTIDSIVSDENLLPASQFARNSETGKGVKVTFCNATHSLDRNGNLISDPDIFSRAFLERTGGITGSSHIGEGFIGAGYRFDTKNGAHWVVRRNPKNMACYMNDVDEIDRTDFVIIFDIDGINKGSNCPYTGENLDEEYDGECSNPDTFKFGTTISNKILPDTNPVYDGFTLEDYIKENNLLKDKF